MFKKIVLTLLLSISSLMASGINWEKDFHAAMINAKKQNKPVLFISSRHSCKYCVILEETTLEDKKVVKALNRDYISVVSYSDENDYMPKELWRPGTPAIWFLLPTSEPMFQPIMGAIGPDDMLKALAIVKDEFDKLENEKAEIKKTTKETNTTTQKKSGK
jgi:hypothetical protein